MISSLSCYLDDYVEHLHSSPAPFPPISQLPPLYLQNRYSTLTWLFDWAARLRLPSHPVQMAVLLTDSFIAQRHITTSEVYRLIAALCLQICTKLEERDTLTMDAVKNELKNCPLSTFAMSKIELLILETEHWSINRPTAASASRVLLQSACPNFDFSAVYECSDAFAALIYCDSDLISENSTVNLAVASVCAALEKLDQTEFRDAWLSRITDLFDPQKVSILLLKIRRRVQTLTSEDETTSGSDTFEDN